MKFPCSILFVFLISVPPCLARDLLGVEQPGEDHAFNVAFGFSPFDGILGFEYQYGKHSLGLGSPGHFSYRHYADPFGDSMFWGVYFGQYSYDENNEIVDGIFYRDFATQFFGFGIGKRWHWSSGWHTNLSLALERYDDEFSNPGSSFNKSETGFFLMPGFNGGYKF